MSGGIHFPTGSSYHGSYNKALHCMEGYGSYMFPDGSEYRGYFKRGKFHGYGRLRLGVPYNFTFVGQYENGKLTHIYEMMYSDGIRLVGEFDKTHIDFNNWLYCTDADRRYAVEIAIGIDPVGLENCSIPSTSMRLLRRGCYDAGGGIFKDSNNFIFDIPPPFYKHRFVGCDKEAAWIRKHCRRGPSTVYGTLEEPIEPEESIGRRIIASNCKQMHSTMPCTCHEASNRKTFLIKLCEAETQSSNSEEASIVTHSEPSSRPQSNIDSSFEDSFSDESMIEDLIEKCEMDVQGLKIQVHMENTDSSDNQLLDDEQKKAMRESTTPRNTFGSVKV